MTETPLHLVQRPPQPSLFEHPDYGTCPFCTKAVRVVKGGWLAKHLTPDQARGYAKASYQCPGQGKRYAEFGFGGKEWNFRYGRWFDLSVPIAVLVRGETTGWTVYTASPTPENRSAAQLLVGDDAAWRIELHCEGEGETGTAVLVHEGKAFNQAVWTAQSGTDYVVQYLFGYVVESLA